MNTRVTQFPIIFLALLLLIASAAWSATPYYAVAAGTSKLYMLSTQADWGDKNYTTLISDPTANFSGIAVSGNLLFAADTAKNSLRVYMVSYAGSIPISAQQINEISLDSTGSLSFLNPDKVVLDATGGVYVMGSAWMDSQNALRYTYAYVKPTSGSDWTNATRNIYELPNSPMVDIAAYGSGNGAIVLHGTDLVGEYGSPAFVSRLNAGTVYPGRPGERLDPADAPGPNQSPEALAVNLSFGDDGYAYIVNRRGAAGGGGTLSVVKAQNLAKMGQTFDLPGNMVPQDICTFSVMENAVEQHYLAIVGAPVTGSPKAIRIQLDSTSGIPLMNTVTEFTLDNAQNHYLAASDDGAVTWMTSVGINKVTVADNRSGFWNMMMDIQIEDIDQSIRRIDTFAVPEPSTMVSLVALAGAGCGFIARRRRA